MMTKTLIALADMRRNGGTFEAWYTEGDPEHFTIELVDLETFDRLYAENMPSYLGMKIANGCLMYSYEPEAEEERKAASYFDKGKHAAIELIAREATKTTPSGFTDVDPLIYDHDVYYFLQGTGRR